MKWLVVAMGVATPAWAGTIYAADVWPSKVSVRPDGSYEYVYDLKPVKAGKLPPDVLADAPADAAASFLKSLPKEARVVVELQSASLNISAPGELENAPAVASFSAVGSGPLAVSSDFDKRPAAGLPALHHDSPKLLPSADMFVWKSRQVDDGILAAVLAGSERGSLGLPMGRRAFWSAVLNAAVKRYQGAEGDGRDGALALAARIGAALRASTGELPAVLGESDTLAKAAEAEPAPALSSELNPGLIAAYGFTSEIGDLENSESILARPMADSRPGFAGAMVFLAILERDPKLAKAYQAIEQLRNDFLGPASDDALDLWKKTASEGAQQALENLGDFFPKLEGKGNWREPRLFAPPRTPIRQFLGSLKGAEKGNALDELAAAMADGRIAESDGSWALLREAALVALVRPEESFGGKLVASTSYHGRLQADFHALFHAPFDASQESAGEPPADETAVNPVLKVRLEVPPHLTVEPLPALYGRIAQGYRRLKSVVPSNVVGLTPSGSRRGVPARAEADQLAKVYRGLELLALRGGTFAAASGEDAAALLAAQRFLSNWRSDVDLSRRDPELGVSRRLIEVGFEGPAVATVVGSTPGKPNAFVTDTSATQSYIVPVLSVK